MILATLLKETTSQQESAQQAARYSRLITQQQHCVQNEPFDCTYVGVSAWLGVGADAGSDVFGHTAFMYCVFAY